jgi:hypothetical protein
MSSINTIYGLKQLNWYLVEEFVAVQRKVDRSRGQKSTSCGEY